MLYVFLWIFGSVIVGGIGAERDCGFLRGFLVSLFVSPLLGGIMVAFCPKRKTRAEMLVEAKVFLDSGALTKDEYETMVNDITTKGKRKDLRSYRKGLIDPFKH